MKMFVLLSAILLGCSSHSSTMKEAGVGASAAQADRQEAAKGMSSPAMPAAVVPEPGTVILQPVVVP